MRRCTPWLQLICPGWSLVQACPQSCQRMRLPASARHLHAHNANVAEQHHLRMLDQAVCPAQTELQMAALDRDLGKKRTAYAAEQARVNATADELDNVKTALIAAKRTLKQQDASCASARCEY